ncbi:TPA: hypothetical protein NH024_001116 [Pseudomonas aeruginosa]|nr:hypothetical protein [Pseudomonas aeruginosa]HCE9445578.1 hypothetical protein [Pseudomonas aeruginosa]
MEFSADVKEYLIQQICMSESTQEAIFLYRAGKHFLPNCKFIFASDRGTDPGFSVNREFSEGAVVRSLFHSSRLLVLDELTLREMDGGGATFPIDYSISLDTQALSYLEPFMAGNVSKLPKDYAEVFEFIAQDNVFVDPLPYCQENLKNLRDHDKAEKIFKKLKSYEVLRNIDERLLSMSGVVRSKLTDLEVERNTQEHMSRMYMSLEDARLMERIAFRQRFMYCQLLKMVVINFKNAQDTVFSKVCRFLEFCDQSLATMGAREIAVAKKYFAQGQNFKFFGKIQKNRPDIFSALDGMAWDLWHIRQLEESMTLIPDPRARYFFPSLLTFDKRFVEVMDLYPLRSLAYVEGESMPMPFYSGDWFTLVADQPEQQNSIAERYYSLDAKRSREARRDGCERNVSSVIDELERELSEFSQNAKKLN